MQENKGGMHQRVFTEEEERELAFLHGRSWEFTQFSADLLKKSIKCKGEERRRFYRAMSQVFTRVSNYFKEFYDTLEGQYRTKGK